MSVSNHWESQTHVLQVPRVKYDAVLRSRTTRIGSSKTDAFVKTFLEYTRKYEKRVNVGFREALIKNIRRG